MKVRSNKRGGRKTNWSSFKSFSCAMLILIALLPLAFSCGSKKIMTQELYMQHKHVSIAFPNQTGEGGSSTGGQLSEMVSFSKETKNTKREDNEELFGENSKLDTSTVYQIQEVTVAVKSNFTPERDGKISIDFLVNIPKELISKNFRLTLTPLLLHNDSVVRLKDMVLKGSEFYSKQISDHAAFDKFEASIVDEKDYDKVFLDTIGIKKDLRKRQNLYVNLYKDEWKKRTAYINWKSKHDDLFSDFNSKQEGEIKAMYHKYQKEADFIRIKNFVQGKDTTGIAAETRERYKADAEQFRSHERIKVPNKFKDIFLAGEGVDDIKMYTATVQDSMQIAKNSYFFRRMAENDSKRARKDEIFAYMVPYPNRAPEEVQLDTVINEGRDFVYLYRQEYPVSPDLKRVRMTMTGNVRAIDRSGYSLSQIDTLTYLISSIDQLVDTTLIYKKTKLYRNMFSLMTIYPKFEANKTAFNINYRDNAAQIDTIMSTYRIFTEDRGLQMDSVVMTASTSLDGTYDNNARLSMERVESIKGYLERSYSASLDVDYFFRANFIGEDWRTLVKLIQQRSDLQNKQEILNMLTKATFPDNCERDIKQMYKNDFKIISQDIYPKLNKVDVAFNMSRSGMLSADSIRSEYRADYHEGIRLLKEKDYWKAFDILINYPDYNTGLCLVCMGANQKAYDLLIQLPKSANTDYLLAIVCYRLDRKAEAVDYLLSACEQDNNKIYRAPRDPDMRSLISEYALQQKLNNIELGITEEEPSVDESTSTEESSVDESSVADSSTTETAEENTEKQDDKVAEDTATAPSEEEKSEEKE